MHGITYEPAVRPGIANLLDILVCFDATGRTAAQLAEHFRDASPKILKATVADAVIDGLQGVSERYKNILSSDDGYLDRVADHGTAKARRSAGETMEIVREAVGL